MALGSPAAVLAADTATMAAALNESEAEHSRQAKIPTLKFPNVDVDLSVLERIGASFIGFNEPDFPPLLNQIQTAPLGLFVLGEQALLCTPQIAIVGSRSPTPSGKRSTQRFAAELSIAGLSITSGMAIGIDSCAHRGCLEVDGKTIAVMATGIDMVYPHANRSLCKQIAENGLIISEYPPGTPPRREYFPQRNRIISGLSLGTLVVEAGLRSGSLVTARLAGEQGREVFAVPGSIHVAVSRGCHRLLRQGAKLVETTEDILEEIGQFFITQRHIVQTRTSVPSDEFSDFYALIDYTPISIDELVVQSGLTVEKVSYILMQLELSGFIAAAVGGYQRLPV